MPDSFGLVLSVLAMRPHSQATNSPYAVYFFLVVGFIQSLICFERTIKASHLILITIMAKDAKPAGRFFAGLSVETGSTTKLLSVGQHIVDLLPESVMLDKSHGSLDGEFDDTIDQLKVRVKSQQDDSEMDIFISLTGHKRLSEITEEDITGVRASHLAMPQRQFDSLTFEERKAAIFDSYTNNENQVIAVSNITAGKLIKRHRVIDPVRSANAQKKVMSLLAHSSALPVGTKVTSEDQVLKALRKPGLEVGVQVSSGILNRKGQSMPRIDYFMSPDNVEVE